jgi:hypothetical protein
VEKPVVRAVAGQILHVQFPETDPLPQVVRYQGETYDLLNATTQTYLCRGWSRITHKEHRMDVLGPLPESVKTFLITLAGELGEIAQALHMLGEAAVEALAARVDACTQQIEELVNLPDDGNPPPGA